MERILKILVVDDEEVVLNSVEKHLVKENYRIVKARTVREGLRILESDAIDIILTDLMMPEIDGLEFMKIIKDRSLHIPMIMITGYATINTALRATQLGAFDYIAKPFTKMELKSVVNRAAELVRAAGLLNGSTQEKNIEASGDSAAEKVASAATGEHVWTILEDDGLVLVGVKQNFLNTIGTIRNIFLPSVGDEIRQGSVYVRIFSAEMHSHTALSPLSGTVIEVNQKVIEDPNTALKDPYGEGWLIRLKPSKFEFEIKEFGL